MIPMQSTETRELETVRRRLREDAAGFVAAEEAQYTRQIASVAQTIAAGTHGSRTVMLCGSSCVGKTTTAKRLVEALSACGVRAVQVSLDDFYLGMGRAPRLPDGNFDYESPLALDLERLRGCMTELAYTGKTRLPRYDFEAGEPASDTTLLEIDGDTAVIFEGIHAFSPMLTDGVDLNGQTPLRVFVNTKSRFTENGEVLLRRRDIRLSRRLLRDERTRASDFYRTMCMWQQVVRGDEMYIAPYSQTADLVIDTTMGYEPALLSPLLLPRLSTLYGTPFEQTARRLEAVYARFSPLPIDRVPANSVLREFVG